MNLLYFKGKRVHQSLEVKSVPKLKLSDGDYISENFRKSMNEYLLNLFGEHYPIEVYGNNVLMNPKTYMELCQQLNNGNYYE